MIRRFIVPLLIAAVFAVGCYFAVRPLAAEFYANRALKLENSRKLDSAMAAYRSALRLDPLSAKYYGELGRLYLKKTRGVADTGLRTDARDAYAKAMELAPTCSKFRLGWGEAEALLLSDKKGRSQQEIDKYVENFKKAVELDPTNYYVNASAGYYILLFRNRISEKDRNFAIYRLRLALEQNPSYRNQVFSAVANGLGDFSILYKITPQTPFWQEALRDFLREIDKWKYGGR